MVLTSRARRNLGAESRVRLSPDVVHACMSAIISLLWMKLGALEGEDLIADRDTDAPPRFVRATKASRTTGSGSESRRVVGRFDSARQRRIMPLVQKRVHCRESSFWCAKAACLGVRLVRDHSSNMSHLTVSSFRI